MSTPSPERRDSDSGTDTDVERLLSAGNSSSKPASTRTYTSPRPTSPSSTISPPQNPITFAPRHRRRHSQHHPTPRSQSLVSRISDLISQLLALKDRAIRIFFGLTYVQRVGVVILGVLNLIAGVLFLVYHERIFHLLTPIAKGFRDIRGGWLFLWASIFVISFPPLIGYGLCVTLAGAVYGVWKGWLLLTSATVIGSTVSFLSSRYLFSSFVKRITANNKRFAILNLVLKHDGLKLLIMIRLCPLPYSASNGFLSTIPAVSPTAFAFATLCMCPKYLMHVFIGSRLAAIAENGDEMDSRTKLVSYLSIALSGAAGVLMGWFMYSKTTARAAELDALEAESGSRPGSRRRTTSEDEEQGLDDDEFAYTDDLDLELPDFDDIIDEDDDAISLRTTDGRPQESDVSEHKLANSGEVEAVGLSGIDGVADGHDKRATGR